MSNSVEGQSLIKPRTGPVFGPGTAQVANGNVLHIRHQPTEHRISAPVQQIWVDPDHPEELFDHHRLWSHRNRAPVRFQWRDYFDRTDQPIGPKVRNALTEVLGFRPDGPIRMLTQPRTWGWLFNPLTVYLVWPGSDLRSPVGDVSGPTGPIGMLLEVDNTPWHERHHYAVALKQSGNRLVGIIAKVLHVSPFLGEDFDYRVSVGGANGALATATTSQGLSSLDLVVNVVPRSASETETPILHTRLRTDLELPNPRSLNRPIRSFPTHRVSLGIHSQALKLFAKRVPFVAHPDKVTS